MRTSLPMTMPLLSSSWMFFLPFLKNKPTYAPYTFVHILFWLYATHSSLWMFATGRVLVIKNLIKIHIWWSFLLHMKEWQHHLTTSIAECVLMYYTVGTGITTLPQLFLHYTLLSELPSLLNVIYLIILHALFFSEEHKIYCLSHNQICKIKILIYKHK